MKQRHKNQLGYVPKCASTDPSDLAPRAPGRRPPQTAPSDTGGAQGVPGPPLRGPACLWEEAHALALRQRPCPGHGSLMLAFSAPMPIGVRVRREKWEAGPRG